MAYLLDIATATPDYSISNQKVIDFYSKFFENNEAGALPQKLPLIVENSKITNRYSCIPDFSDNRKELFTEDNYDPSIEARMVLYRHHILPLAVKSIDNLLQQTGVSTRDITHIISVTCTGLLAPGLEFLVADHYNITHVEKTGLNYLGCYAALKALKHANVIAQADPDANVLVVCAELCSLHFNSSCNMEEVISNLLFSDGAASFLVCGNNSQLVKNKVVFHIDSIGSETIQNTLDLMTWSISSTAFRMHLSRKIITALRENIFPAVDRFLGEHRFSTGYWAIHPGGIRIVKAVMEGLHLKEEQVSETLEILKHYGNMSSPTILFILKKIFDKIKSKTGTGKGHIFSCAFGPGLNIEMIRLSPVDNTPSNSFKFHSHAYVTQGQIH